MANGKHYCLDFGISLSSIVFEINVRANKSGMVYVYFFPHFIMYFLEILYKITLDFCYIFKVSCLRFVISLCVLFLFWQLEMYRVRPLF
jgi:hypothetical protein